MTPSATVRIAVTVNGRVVDRVVPAATTLVDLLRSHLGLTGTKFGCGVGDCGSCTVLVDDEPALSCLVLAAELDGRTVTTIEDEQDERIRRLQQAFVATAGLQCGFCTPGMILAASRLPPDADADAIRSGLVGNLCRCTGYSKIVTAVRRAGRRRVTRGTKK